jgi:hypothetical protein
MARRTRSRAGSEVVVVVAGAGSAAAWGVAGSVGARLVAPRARDVAGPPRAGGVPVSTWALAARGRARSGRVLAGASASRQRGVSGSCGGLIAASSGVVSPLVASPPVDSPPLSALPPLLAPAPLVASPAVAPPAPASSPHRLLRRPPAPRPRRGSRRLRLPTARRAPRPCPAAPVAGATGVATARRAGRSRAARGRARRCPSGRGEAANRAA